MSTKKVILPLVLVLSLAVVACKPAKPAPSAGTNQAGDVMMEKKDGATMLKLPLTLQLAAQNNSGITGTATITEVNGKAKVLVSYTGGPENTPQPAHIHSGQCPTPGGVMYPLTSPVNGASVTTLTVSVDELMKQEPWAINIHKSAAEATTYVACASGPRN